MAGDPILPEHYYQARKGRSTFLFRVPIPASSPSTITFGTGVAKVRYELRASVGVYWKSEKRLVLDKRPVEVVEAYPFEESRPPEAIVIGENGKLWMQGKIVGNVIVAGESACLELQVKNHSNKKVRILLPCFDSSFKLITAIVEYWSNFDAYTHTLSSWFCDRNTENTSCSSL